MLLESVGEKVGSMMVLLEASKHTYMCVRVRRNQRRRRGLG
jgi:hypothetical protein